MPRSEPSSIADRIALAWAIGVAIVYGARLIAVRFPWVADWLGVTIG